MSIRQKVSSILSQPLVGNMFTVGIISLLVSILAFYKETIIAGKIGLNELLDTFYIAILIPSFIQNVFIGGLKQLFIPNYLAENQDINSKKSFQSITFVFIAIMAIILSILSLIFVKYGLSFVFPGHDLSYYDLIRKQFYIILPCLLLWGFTSLISGLLEIENKFLISSISPVFSSLGMLISLFYFKDALGDYVLAIGILIGTVSGFLFLLYFSFRYRVLALGRIVLNHNIILMLRQLPAKVTSSFLSGINPFVDQFFAAQLVVGSIGALNYGIKIPTFGVGILMLVLGNVLLPHFSKLVHKDLNKAYKQLFKVLKIVFFCSLVCALAGMIISTPIIQILFERDAFTTSDTAVVSKIQVIALIYVPFYLCTLVCVKFLTAINRNKFMAWTSLWNLLINLFLNWWLIKEFGIYGLVASTTLMFIISSFIYVGYAWKSYKKDFPM